MGLQENTLGNSICFVIINLMFISFEIKECKLFSEMLYSKKCQNYRTISLISHPSKIMLKTILNRLKDRADELQSKEQAGFRPERSTVEHICTM